MIKINTFTTKWFGFLNNPFCSISLSDTTLFMKRGILLAKEDSLKLNTIKDLEVTQTISDRICGSGSIILYSTDLTNKKIVLPHVVNYTKLRDLISNCMDREIDRINSRSSYISHTGGIKSEY